MERLLFDVQNNVEYSLLALGISQTISKVKLNQLNQLNQLNCASLISNKVIPMISQSHILNNCAQTLNPQGDAIPIQSVIDLTNQRTRSNSMTAISLDKKSETSHSESNISTNTNNSKTMKMTSLDKLDKLIDETVKKSTGKISSNDDDVTSPGLKSANLNEENLQTNMSEVNLNMGNAIHQIIRQFYHNASSSINSTNNGFIGNNLTESICSNVSQPTLRPQTDLLKSTNNSFSQQVTELFTANSQTPFNSLGNRSKQSFILYNNLPTSSIINGPQRESFLVSMNNSLKENNAPSVNEPLNENNNTTEDTESTSNREEDELCFAELDPTEVATKIRDILSLHSIGQRLFAKHVLNLSQGTVSELLSKPKPWSKLSEKGRDSYRKMNQWAQDASKVQELKSIAPRKGFSGHYAGMSPATPIKEDHETQEKIKRILNDAKMAMASTNSQSTVDDEIFSCYAKSNAGDLPNDGSQLTTVICNPVQTIQKSVTNVMEFDISQLQKKLSAAIHSTVLPISSSRVDPLAQMSSSSTYQQSPLILMNLANIVPCSSSVMVSSIQPSQSSIFPSTTTNIITNNHEKPYNRIDFNFTENSPLNEIDSLNFKSEMKTFAEDENMLEKCLVKDLDKKLSEDQFNGLKNKTSKSIADLENLENFLKSFIGSIKLTGNCFQNEEMNTTELVNVIKDHLTKNSISQRTFGCLLGLSQGTVSDILSRPKPWSMLTNKGREPYIRMLKYLLKPTQSKNSENCTIKNNVNQNPLMESLPNSSSSPSSSDAALTYDQNIVYDEKNEYNNQIPINNENEECNVSSSTEDHNYQSSDEDFQNNEKIYANESPILSLDQLPTENLKFNDPKEKIFSIASRILSLDTVELTNKVKEVLNSNNLGQRIFGEYILNLSQASVSDLLSKPKSWNQLSSKGREPYIRMYLWLQHPDRLHLLCKANENKKGESNFKDKLENEKTLRIMNINDPNHNYVPTYHNQPKTSSKRTRVVFTEVQKSELKNLFDKYPYPKSDQLNDISKSLNLTITTVGNWFHNQRIKKRSENKHLNQSSIKMESLSGESEINSEKSLPMNMDDIFDGSDSENSISAPHLYPESNHQEYSAIHDSYQERTDEDDYYTVNHSTATIAGSNKRKRTNPIKLEMVLSKSITKDCEDHYSVYNEREPNLKENLFAIKVQKLENNTL